MANTWHFKPTVANTLANVNLMSVMNINWFNIWCGSDTDTAMQDGHYTWDPGIKAMHAHQKLQRVLAHKTPVVDVAIWHGWEGVCGWNTPGLANAHKAFCLNTSQLFIKRSIAADFVDSRLLAESRIEDGRLVNRLGSYKILVVPFAMVMPRAAFEACVAFATAGGCVVFVGTPVAFDEAGKSLSAGFAALLQMPEMSAAHYMRGFDCTLPNFRPQRLEVCRRLAVDLPNKLVSCEGEVHGVKVENIVFLTDLDPQDRLIEQIESACDRTVQAYGDNLLWRLYRDGSGDSLIVASADSRPLRGVVFWGTHVLKIQGGSAGVFTLDKSGKPTLEGDLLWEAL